MWKACKMLSSRSMMGFISCRSRFTLIDARMDILSTPRGLKLATNAVMGWSGIIGLELGLISEDLILFRTYSMSLYGYLSIPRVLEL